MKFRGNKKENYSLTYKQLAEIEDELWELKLTKRRDISTELRKVREQGNYTNNLYYSELKDAERKNETRISELEYILKYCTIVDEEAVDIERITLGCKVKLFDYEYDEEVVYSIVDAADVDSIHNKISNQSPIGKALLGKKIGDIVNVKVAEMLSKYKVLGIEGVEFGYAQENKKVEKKVDAPMKSTNPVETKDISPKDFITRVNVFKCTSDNHKLVDIKCRVKVLSESGKVDTYVVPGTYCQTCDRYFMLDTEYKRLKQKGILVCKVVEKEFWLNNGKRNDFNLNEESLLHMMGYNVSQQVNLSKEQRWGILELIVDEEILSIMEIRSHLNWLIRRNQNNRNFDDARCKWQMDSEHLLNYDSKNPDMVDVGSITSKNYRK
jgi:transcription elongation factor GreA